jgi:hypothetical protein
LPKLVFMAIPKLAKLRLSKPPDDLADDVDRDGVAE